jgi:neutral ceramidase
MTLRAGAAKVEFRLAPGELMAAFPRGPERIPRRAKGSLDALGARALVLSDGDETVALCSADLCMLRDVGVRRIRDSVAASVPELAGSRVLLATTHTHSGPETSFLFGGTPEDKEVRRIEEEIAEAIRMAHGNLAPVRMGWNAVGVPLVHNRRVTNREGRSEMILEHVEGVTVGPVDPVLQVLRFDDEVGNPRIALCHYTAHALTLGPANDYFSSDYPGRVRERIEEAYPDCTALFVNGAAGDVHPHACVRVDTSALKQIGDAVGSAAVSAIGEARVVSGTPLALRTDTITFPNRVDASLRVPVEIDLLDLGDLRMAFLPGEFFVEFQLAWNERVRPRRGMCVGYANGQWGYVPTRESYRTGGYGVDAALKDPPRWCRTALPEGAGERIMERLMEMTGAA